MLCPECGRDITDEVNFCSKCGHDLRSEKTAEGDQSTLIKPEMKVTQELSEEDLKFLKKIDLPEQLLGYKKHNKKQIILKIDFGSIRFRRGSIGYGLYVITTNRLMYLPLDEETGLRRVHTFEEDLYFVGSLAGNELTEIVDVRLERGIFRKPVVTIDWVQRLETGPFDIWTCTGLRDPEGFVRKLKELTKGDENIRALRNG